MNSSSAMNNVLVAPATPSAPGNTPKRTSAADQANDFQQAWQDVRAGQTAKAKGGNTGKIHNDDKSVPARNEQKQAREPNIEREKPVRSDNREDNVTQNTQPKKADAKVKKADAKSDEVGEAGASTQQQATSATTPESTPLLPGGLALMNPNGQQSGSETENSDGDTLDAVGLTASLETDGNADGTVAANSLPDDKAANNLLLTGDAGVKAAPPVVDTDTPTEESSDPANPVLVGGATGAKSANISLVNQADDGDTTDTLAESVQTMVADSKNSPAKMPMGDALADDTSGQPSQTLNDPKATFEKMLQTVANASAGQQVRDADSQLASPANSAGANAVEPPGRIFDTAQSPAARSFVVQTSVPVNVGQPQWSQAVGEKVLWLAAQNVSSAEINLNPLDLGPMQVKVSVNQDQTTVSFASHHPMVREVLDQNLNRLRDMFSDQGLNLVNVDVSDRSFSRQQGDTREQAQGNADNSKVVEEETPVAVSTIMQKRLVDHYA